MLARPLLSAGLCCCIAFTTSAAEVPTTLPDGARWVTHVDVSGVLEGPLGDQVRTIAERPEVAQKLKALHAFSGFKPLEHLQSISMVGADPESGEYALLLRGTFDRERLEALAGGLPGYEQRAFGDLQVHRWTDDDQPTGRMHAFFLDDELLVLSPLGSILERIFHARDQSDSAPTLRAALAAQVAGSVVLGAATDFAALAKRAPRARMLQKVRSLSLGIVFEDDDLVARLEAEAVNEESATNIFNIAQGMLALARMQGELPPPLHRLLASLQLSRDGELVILTQQLPVSDVIELLQQRSQDDVGLLPE